MKEVKDWPILSSSERRIFEMVWRHRPISRANLATESGMTPMSVTRVVRALHEKGLVSDSPQRTGQRGQPARPVDLVADAAMSVGVSFTYAAVEVVVALLDGTIMRQIRHPLAEFSPKSLIRAIDEEIDKFLQEERVSTDRLLGIGVSVPADFISDASFDFSNKPKFEELFGGNVGSAIQSSFALDVFVENDSTAAAMGEMIYGVGRNFENFVYVNLGYGVGAGVIMDRSPYRGTNGNAGVISGYFPYSKARPSGADLLDFLRERGHEVNKYRDLRNLVPTECPDLMTWINRAGGQLREGLSHVARVLDPDALVVGGRLPNHINQYLASAIDTSGFCHTTPNLPKPRVVASILGPQAHCIGAVAVPIYRRLLHSGS